ncbi:MAG: TlpA family protein disulfide reductase [Myxococcales bacterium]|nr:TlpA family protein disulfide reductase [Myxococcales bacterium]
MSRSACDARARMQFADRFTARCVKFADCFAARCISSAARRAADVTASLMALLLVVGCEVGNGEPIAPAPGSGGERDTSEGYPTVNVGTSVGNVIADFSFEGFADPSASHDSVEIRLADFYNPTGSGAATGMGAFAAAAVLPKALVVNVSAVWCAPCKDEAKNVFPQKWSALHPRGMEILLVLADSGEVGDPATLEDLDAWTSAFPGSYPAVIDPSYQMGALFDASQFPANFIIDTRTMEIVEFVGGKPPESFWQKVESLLD